MFSMQSVPVARDRAAWLQGKGATDTGASRTHRVGEAGRRAEPAREVSCCWLLRGTRMKKDFGSSGDLLQVVHVVGLLRYESYIVARVLRAMSCVVTLLLALSAFHRHGYSRPGP